VTSRHDDELEFAARRVDQILQSLSADKSAVAFHCLKKQEVSFVLVLVVRLTNVLIGVFHAVSGEVDSQRFRSENFLETFNSALLTRNRDHRLRLRESLLDDLKLFSVVKLRNDLQLGFIVAQETQGQGAGEHEGKVEVFLFSHMELLERADAAVLLNDYVLQMVHFGDTFAIFIEELLKTLRDD